MKFYEYLWVVLFCLIPMAASCQQLQDPYQYFYKELKKTPHEKIDSTKGRIIFEWDKKEYNGFKIKFISNDSLMAEEFSLFWPEPENNKYLYQQGWRSNKNYSADGPGTTLYGIQKNDILCLISESQPAYLNNGGRTIQESKITVTVECIEKENE